MIGARRGLILVLAVVGGLAAALIVAGPALAHPLGNFTINRYARIEVHSDRFVIQYVVDTAEIPTFQLIGEIDANHDGTASQEELNSYASRERDRLAANFKLVIDGKTMATTPGETTIQLLPGAAGLQITRLAVVYDGALPGGLTPSSNAQIVFTDSNFADRAGWKEVVVVPSAGAQVAVDPKFTIDTSDALRNYPSVALTAAPDVRQVSFSWVVGSGTQAPPLKAVVGSTTRSNSGFSSLLESHQSLGVILLSLLAAFGFGMLHALGPGHGKTVVAAYLVGTKGTPRHALALGFTVTATHTFSVYLLGFVTITASAFIVPERLYLYLGIGSGLMVMAMGAALFLGRLWQIIRRTPDGEHRHGLGKAHSHAPARSPLQPVLATASAPLLEYQTAIAVAGSVHGHGGTHTPHVSHSEASPTQPRASVTWRSLLTLGIAGGILPCPSAIVVMLAAIALGQVIFGMLLIVAFSLGLAGVLTAIGLVLVFGKRLSGRSRLVRTLERPAVARLMTALPIVSAFGLTLAGLYITYQAMSQPGL